MIAFVNADAVAKFSRRTERNRKVFATPFLKIMSVLFLVSHGGVRSRQTTLVQETSKEIGMVLPFTASRWSLLASLFTATMLASGVCVAGQWPTHPLPTKSSEVATYARDIGLRSVLSACLKKTDGTTSGIRDCMRDEHDFQDHRLNESYKKLMGLSNEADRRHLREEERRWIMFRDKFCAPDSEPGQAQDLETDECVVDQTADRATELASRLDRR